ncbi:galectin-related protein-like [Kryptolebias marmoratus]|uniref:Galectin n=1 Tax=Kryptolebias marmoratus TaxID=37003 RepID=A0A3Q3AR05_KRYMA|nr:galectin-related protein-like [Kryptolebias marmoratus]
MKMADSHRTTALGRKRWSLPQRSETDQSKMSTCPEGEAERKLVVPYRGHISDGLKPGKKIVVVGVVDPHPDRFYVALTCGLGTSEPPPNVALELCVRFKDRQVLRRACVSGTWGDMDRAVPFFPFIKDQPFKIEIYSEQSRFRVFVDGQHLFSFQHKVLPLSDIDTLWIKGTLSITKLA